MGPLSESAYPPHQPSSDSVNSQPMLAIWFWNTRVSRACVVWDACHGQGLGSGHETRHYDYDHTGCIDFSPDLATSSECSAYKCQDCNAKHNVVINAINALTASVKKMASNRGFIPSKRISYPYTPLEIKAAKRRRKDTSKASSSIQKSKIAMPLSLSCADDQFAKAAGEHHNPNKVLVVVVLKERRIHVYDSMSRKRCSRPSSEIQKLAKILPTYLYMSGFLDQKVHTKWLTIEAYLYKMANPFDVQYVEGISQQTIGSLNCGSFVATYAEYLSDGLQVPNDGLDARLLCKIYAALLLKYREAKAQKLYASYVKYPRQPKPNFVTLDEPKTCPY
ncbi:hypothetical protein T459_12919 [Capsicum annuum]|uniref:Ubiquitin-like protease family profile domain-containing protein n=1 Tax=Capsicum annuum TaxID=4072 RepID=A0A2G2ZR61_CAPAN|nr:hypothetical protein T459_12919 [Capsicum annuum]